MFAQKAPTVGVLTLPRHPAPFSPPSHLITFAPPSLSPSPHPAPPAPLISPLSLPPFRPPNDRANEAPVPHLATRARHLNSDVLRRGRRQRRSLQIRPPSPRGDGRGRVVKVTHHLAKPYNPTPYHGVISPSPQARAPAADPCNSRGFCVGASVLTSTWSGLSWASF